ncbi:uncharacterized protein V1513DRAFT_433957 [Lipomyces chichibuensis]|uniref:uncharacterized protein n=1 Tax=Lipomyces chichibuensis TaxID=1546026 RepID=UPI0033433B98
MINRNMRPICCILANFNCKSNPGIVCEEIAKFFSEKKSGFQRKLVKQTLRVLCNWLGFWRPLRSAKSDEYHEPWRSDSDVSSRRPKYNPLYQLYKYGTTVWSPLVGDILTGKYNDGFATSTSYGDTLSTIIPMIKESRRRWDAKIEKVKKLAPVAEELGCTTALARS